MELKLTAVYSHYNYVQFFKNGKLHNAKNAAYINRSKYKEFYLNEEYYEYDFTKESWQRFVKLQCFK